MNYEERIKLYKIALKTWGAEAQCMVAIEESAELLAELSMITAGLTKRLKKFTLDFSYRKG